MSPLGIRVREKFAVQPAWQAGRVGVLQEPQDVSPWPDLASVVSCATPPHRRSLRLRWWTRERPNRNCHDWFFAKLTRNEDIDKKSARSTKMNVHNSARLSYRSQKCCKMKIYLRKSMLIRPEQGQMSPSAVFSIYLHLFLKRGCCCWRARARA